jgi:hypothetical protein
MSAGLVAVTLYFAIALFAMLALCRAASRGDRPMAPSRSV